MTGLRPGMQVDMIVSMDMLRETIDVRRSMVYSVEKSTLILSQTNPPLDASHIGKMFDITFLKGTGDRQVRMGFTARLNSFLNNYRLVSSETVQALVVTANPQNVSEYNLRMFHRVRPASKSDLKLLIGGREVSLSNLSVGGLCYVYPYEANIKAGSKVSARLAIGGTVFGVDLKVIRIASTPELKRLGVKHISVEFVDPDRRMSNLLSGKILDIERELRSRGLES